VETDTLDITGKILGEERPVSCTQEDIERAFRVFHGRVLQTPPMYSAIKHEGVPLYCLARAGKEIERRRRLVEISDLQITKLDVPRVEFRVVCSKGTYVRTLASDIGAHLGCGACLEQLRRTKSGDFSLSDSVDLVTLESTPLEKIITLWLIPPARALVSLPPVTVSDAVAENVLHGRIVTRSEVGAENLPCREEILLKIVNQDGELLAVAETTTRHVTDEPREGEDSPAWKLLRVFRLAVPEGGAVHRG
jgi:tRNA pseudouridine55 synthase